MSKTNDALNSQTELLNEFSAFARDILQRDASLQQENNSNAAKIAALLDTDEDTATEILSTNTHIKSLIDDLSAASPASTTTASSSPAAS